MLTPTPTPTPTPTSYGFSLIELLIALFLGTLLCIGIFNLFSAMQQLHQKQMILSNAQEQTRFISLFLREKIQTAGDWSCLSQSHPPRSIMIRVFDSDEALEKLGLTIKPKTDLLQLHECIRIQGKKRYLPIEFFIADTFRVDWHKKNIFALFFKIDHHPREELITDMTDFKIRLYHLPKKKTAVRAVKINYALSSISDAEFQQAGILYVAVRKMEV